MTDRALAFLMDWEQEHATTARVLGALPPTSLDWRPHAKSMTAGELAWHLVGSELWFARGFLDGRMPQEPWPKRPDSLHALLQASAMQHQSLVDRVRQAPPESWTREIDFVGRRKFTGTTLLKVMMMRHAIHHRGQLSVYLRLLDTKGPSIYGPSADDKGM